MCMYSFLINRNAMLCYIVLMFSHNGCFLRLCLIAGLAQVQVIEQWSCDIFSGLGHNFLLKKSIRASMQSLTVKTSTPGYVPEASARKAGKQL